MENFELTEYFEYNYLTPGHTRDNFVFYGCPKEVIEEAEKSLVIETEDIKPCLIKITRDTENALESVFDKCKNDMQKKIIARSFFVSLFLRELGEDNLNDVISALSSGDYNRVAEVVSDFPLPYDIAQKIRKIDKKIELNILLIGTENVLIQQAINNYLSSREPYSIKLFTTGKTFPTNYDQCGNLVQWPHDYLSVNVDGYIKEQAEDNELL